MTLGALGGIYIGGGIVPRLGDYFDRSGLRARYEDLGRFSAYLGSIPTYVVTAVHATFEGASSMLATQLRTSQADPGSALLAPIQRARKNLSPAEKRVADPMLAHPRSALNDAIADLAKAAQVSQPTVIRFCRSLGCVGLSDFKLRLASGLSGSMPLTHTQVTVSDSVLELGVKVLGNTASAMLQVRDQLNRDTLVRAIELLAAAQRIEFFAVGHRGVVADDAQLEFLRFGVPSASFTDPRLQVLAANVLRPSDVVVIISSGRVDDLLAVADMARQRGAAVLAIIAGHHRQPFAAGQEGRRGVDHRPCRRHGDAGAHAQPHPAPADHRHPGRGRGRGLGAKHGVALAVAAAEDLAETQPLRPPSLAAQRVAPGIRTAGPLARLTSHCG